MTNDGGPAFPTAINEWPNPTMGMSLRDWFAGMALMGSFSNPNNESDSFAWADTAADAYSQADAMLKERERR